MKETKVGTRIVAELLQETTVVVGVTNYSVRICRTTEQQTQGQTHLLPKRNYRPFMAQWSSIHGYCCDQWCTVTSNTSSQSMIAWENKLPLTNCQSIHAFSSIFTIDFPFKLDRINYFPTIRTVIVLEKSYHVTPPLLFN